MSRRWLVFLLCSSSVLTACDGEPIGPDSAGVDQVAVAPPVPVAKNDASSARATVVRTSIAGIQFNSCTNEIMNVEMSYVSVGSTSTDAHGQLHFLGHTRATGTAVGTVTGTVYVALDIATITDEAYSSDGAESFTITASHRMIGRGSAPNLQAHTTFHFAIVNGTLIASVSNIRFDCFP